MLSGRFLENVPTGRRRVQSCAGRYPMGSARRITTPACDPRWSNPRRSRKRAGTAVAMSSCYLTGGAITAPGCACTVPWTPFGVAPTASVCGFGTMERSSAAVRIWPRSSAYRMPWKPAMMLSLPSQHQPGFGLTSSSLISPLASARKSKRA